MTSLKPAAPELQAGEAPRRVCGYCGGAPAAVGVLVMGPEFGVCDACVALMVEIREDALDDSSVDTAAAGAPFSCSFCGSSPARGLMLAWHPPAGLGVVPAICADCLSLAQEVIAERRSGSP